MKVTVADSEEHNGTLLATVTEVTKATGETTESLVTAGTRDTYTFGFVNEYKATGELPLSVTKKVVDSEGNPYKEDLRKDLIFTFVLYQGLDAIQQITVSGEELFAVGSADNTGSATVSFEALQYDITSVGNTYTYTVREIVTGTNLPAGYSVNQESYTIKVEPSDNGNGTLDVTPVITKAGSGVVDEIAYTNVYKPEGATSLTLSKMLDGKKNGIPEDTFSVSIRQLKLDDSGKPYKDDIDDYASDDAGAVADINAQGSASFIPSRDYDSQIVGGTVYNKFNFRAPGTYWYLVTENIPADAENANDGTYSYDTTKYFVKITMSDDYQGHLTRSVLEVHKGSPDDPVASAESASGITFVNLSTTGYEVYKEWEDNGTGTTLDSVTVQLQRKTGSGEWQNVGDPVVLNDDNEWHNAWTALEKYDASQNKYEYRAVETASNKVIEAGGTIAGKYGSSYVAGYTDTAADEMNNTGSTTITNTIQNGNITVKKTVTGRGGDMDRVFNFTVKFWLEEDNTLTGSYLWEKKGSDGSTTSGTAVLSSGEYAFTLKHGEEITFKDLPVGVKYKVTEEDASADGYAATVSDAGSGTIKGSGSTVTYKNYYAKGSLTLKGAKTISNMPADSSRTFNFQVKEGTKVKTTGSATVNSDGTTNFSFAPIEYTLSDLPSDGKFTYTIEEVRPADATQNTDGTYTYQGYTYDSSVYTVEVTVTDDGEGNLGPVITEVKKDGEKLELVDGDYTFGFGNSYLAVGSTQIKAQKLLDDQGDKVTADTFEFTLTEGSVDRNVFTEKEGGQNQQAKAAAGGAVAFNKIDYTTEGTYWYRIVENDVDGYICDKTEYFVKVEVTDDKAGELTAVQTLYCGGTDEEHRYSGSEIQFTNYTTTSFMAEKKWNDDTEALRPDSVYIMLMRSTDLNNWNLVNVNNSVNGDGSPNYLDDIAQLTAGNGWKKTWTNLEKNVFGDATAIYYYKAVEVAVTKTGDEITDFQILSSGSTISTKNGNSNYVVSYDDVDYDAEIPVSVIQNSLGGNVRVQKVVNNEVDPDQEFSFRLVFRSAPKPYAETYGYRIYTVNGTEESTVKIGSITYAANYDFKLKNGQILEIQNLPIGTRYELYEDNISGYTVEYTNKAGELTEDTPTVTVTATNTYFASGSLTLQAGKRLNDERTIVPQDTFTFELVEAAAGEDGAILTVKEEDAVPDAKIVVPDTENGGITGTVTFSTITKSDDSGIYNTENGTDYWYILTEKSLTGDAGKAYESDPTIYCIRVNVKDIDHNGSLTLTKKVYTGTQNEDGTITVGSEIDGIPVFDNYSTISITARKVWSGDDAVKELTRPASVLVALQKKIITDGTEGTWENVEIQALSEDNDWAYTWDGLRNTEKTDSHILEYTYRAVEVALKADKAEEDPSTLTAADYEQITEFDGRGGSLYEVSGPVVAADGSTNTITNTLQTADLKLEKAVIGSGEDQDTEFTFVIELTDKDGNALTGTYDYNIYTKGADGDTLTESGSLNSYIKLKHSQYVAVKNLPIGTKYTVTETENKEYSTAWSVAGGNAGTGTTMTGTIMRSSEETQAGSYVTYTNTRLHGLNISKQQSGGSSNDTFQVQVEVQYAGETELALYSGDYILYTADAPDGISGSTEDGKITFRDGETIHIDLPYNTEYKVTEILTSDDEDPSTWYEAPLYSVSTTDSEEASEPSEEPAEGNSSVGSAVYIQNQHKTGSLQISKSAEGGYPDAEFAFQVGLNILDTDKTQQYTVTYTKTDEDGKTVTAKPDTYIDSENDDHPGNVVLQAGWTAVIESIDTGKTVTVTETSVTALIDDVVTEIPLSEYDTFINGSDTVSRDRIYRTSIAEDKQYTASYRNVYKTGSISIKKKNASENGHKDEVITSSEAVFVLLRRIGSKWYYMTSYDGQKSYDAVTWSEEGYTLEELEETDFDSELTDAYRITTTLGECILDHMEIGAYGLIEIEAPEGFDKTEEAILFELTEEAPDEDGEIPAICESVSVGNREKYGSVKFTKIDSVTELPLDGATFILTRTDLAEPVQIVKFTSGSEAEAEIYAEDDEDNPTIYHEVTVERDENGVTAITNLPWGVYTLKEICSPEYVQPDTEDPDYEAFTEEFLIGLNQENNFLQDIDKGILRNIRVRGDLTIRKIVSSRYEADFDKEFEYTVTIHDFYQSVAAGEKYLLKITDIDGQETVKDLVLDEDGNVTEILKLKADETAVISGIPAGSIYSVEEKEDIDFTGEIRAVGAEVDPEDPLKAEGTITGETTAHSAFYTNTRNTAEVSFTKLDKLSGAVVTGTSFEIREQTAAGQTDKVIAFTIRTKGDGYGLTDITYGSVYEPKDDGEVIHAAVDETGKITVSGLRYGTYELIETEVAGGYEWPDDEVAGICTLGAENKKGRFGTDGIVENTPTQVEIRKTDLVDLEIVGAALEIRYAKDFTAPDGTMYKADTLAKDQSGTVLQWTSDGTGKKIIGLYTQALYTLVETAPPTGYAYAEAITFSMDKFGIVSVFDKDGNAVTAEDGIVKMEDTPLHFIVNKVKSGSTEEIEGAYLTVYNSRNEIVDSWISKVGETHDFGRVLTAGETYILRETKVPDGYQYIGDMKFQVAKDGTITTEITSQTNNDGTVVYLVENTATSTSTARKVWSGDDAVKELTRPASVLVALQKKIITDGTEGTWENVEIQALSEDNDWAYTWDGLRNTEKTDSHILEYTYRAVEVALKADKAEEDPSTLTAADYEQITEFDGRGGSLYEVSGPVVAADGSTNTITNTLQTADLKLEKAVIGSGEDQDTEFTFVIELTDKDGNALTGTYDYNIYTKGADGDTLTESGSLNSYIKLKHSQYVAVKNLPIGTKYTVTETENKEYSTAWSVAGGNAGTGTTMTGTIMRSSEETQAGSYVTYTNTRLHGLNISKQQSGGSSNDTFQVQVEVQYAGETELALYSGDYILYTADAPDGISGSTEDGKITFRDGETIHIDLPYNTEYKVTEILTSDDEDPSTWYEAPLYSVSTTDSEEASEPSEEPAEGNSSVGSAVYIQNQHKTGSLQISKSAEGGYPDAEFAFQVGLNILDTDKTQQYTVTYTKTDEDGKTVTAKPDTYIDSENDDHPGNVVLQAGWTAVIESIDTGKTVTVTETSVTALIDDVVTEIPLSEYDTFINGSDTVSRDRIYRTSIAEDKQYTASYRNVYKTGSISIKKKNASENGHKDEVITSSEAVFVLLRRIGSKWYYMTSYDGQKSYDAVTWSEEGYTLEELEETDFDSELTDAYRITTTLGECILDHMEIGAYGLIEIEAPEGFDKTEEAILFELTEEAPDEDGEIPAICESVSVGNREKYGSVKFTKIDSVTELPLDGATFILTRTDLAEPVQIVKFTSGSEAEAEIYAEDDEDNPTIYHEVTVERDENGVTAITNLPWGVYTLKEICSPEYVQPDTEDPDYEAFTEEFLIGLNQENNFLQDIDKGILRNIRVRGDLTIRKIVSSRYEADFDKEFEYTVTIHDFYQSVAAGEKYLLKITDIDGQETVKDLVLDEDGNVTEILKLKADETAVISGIPAGSIYSVEEKEDIDFTGEIRAVGAEVDPEDPLKAEGTITGETTAHSAFYTNTRNTAEVSFTKLDKLSGAVVTGTSFEIREQTAAGQTDKVIAFTIRTKGDGYGLTDITYGSVYEPKDDGEVIHAAVDETGKITVSGLRYGTYELIETEVAGGYEWPDDEVAGICTLGAENKKGRFGTDGIVENTPTQVEIRKTDLVDLEIVGAALEIRYAKDFTAPDGTMYKADTLAKDQSGTVLQWTSDGTGKKIIGLYTQALYTLVETAPPTGYAYAEAITFSMDKFGIVSVFDKDGNAVTAEDGIVKMEDTPLHFIVNKVKSGSTEEIEGAYLTVYNSRNEIVDSWISKVGETHDFGRVLTAGETYILRETKVPDGYQYIGDMKFQVAKDGTITTEITSQTNNDGTVVYLVENTATSTRFEKVDENNNLLAGAVLQILDKSGTVVHEWTTTSDAYEVTGLTADTEYILHEKKAPSGYTYAEDITFTVSVKETVTVTMVDKRSKEPKTGDDTPITMHLLLLTAAVMAMLVLAIFRRRRRAELLK